jgi:AraC family transcriptional activator of mtrCDE
MSDRPNLALLRSDLDVLMATLDVDVIGLIECLVSPGWRLSFGSVDAPAIHYNLSGTGQMVVGGFSTFPLVPHTLVITPAKKPFHIEVDDRTAAKTVNAVEAQWDPRFGDLAGGRRLQHESPVRGLEPRRGAARKHREIIDEMLSGGNPVR